MATPETKRDRRQAAKLKAARLKKGEVAHYFLLDKGEVVVPLGCYEPCSLCSRAVVERVNEEKTVRQATCPACV